MVTRPPADLLDLNELRSRYGRSLSREAYRLTENREDAEDLLQILWVRVWRFLKRKELRDPAGVEALLFSALRRLHFDVCRAAGRRIRAASLEALLDGGFDPPALTPTPEEIVLRMEELALLYEALRILPREERAAVVLDDLRGVEYRNLRGNSSTWRNRRRRGVARMQSYVRQDEGRTGRE